jgi:hypothetical protein
MRKQQAVYWPCTGRDKFGKAVYGTAVEILVRWADVNEQFTDKQAETKMSNSKIFVDRDMNFGDVLWLGPIDSSILNVADPLSNVGAGVVQSFSKIPDIKVKEFLRKVYL